MATIIVIVKGFLFTPQPCRYVNEIICYLHLFMSIKYILHLPHMASFVN